MCWKRPVWPFRARRALVTGGFKEDWTESKC